jgi:hypothetical protein
MPHEHEYHFSLTLLHDFMHLEFISELYCMVKKLASWNEIKLLNTK